MVLRKSDRTLAGDELLIEALLADLHVDPVAQKGLLVPNLPQPGSRRRLDPADRLHHQQVIGAQAAAADIPGADVERAPLPAERRLGVEADAHQRHPVIGRSCLDAAGDIAEHLVGVLNAEG